MPSHACHCYIHALPICIPSRAPFRTYCHSYLEPIHLVYCTHLVSLYMCLHSYSCIYISQAPSTSSEKYHVKSVQFIYMYTIQSFSLFFFFSSHVVLPLLESRLIAHLIALGENSPSWEIGSPVIVWLLWLVVDGLRKVS